MSQKKSDKRILSMIGRKWNGIQLIGLADTIILNSNKTAARGKFKCFCGTEFDTRLSSILNGHCKSCGCHKTDIVNSHGEGKLGQITIEYSTWRHIKERCNNPNAVHYNMYGGAGITVSPEWRNSYSTFLADMGRKPGKEYQIDRIISEKGYMKSNCRWVTSIQNLANRFRNIGKSGYIGVELLDSGNYRIKADRINNRKYHSASEAAYAYDNYIINKYGSEYAATNLRVGLIHPTTDIEFEHVQFFENVKDNIREEEAKHPSIISGLRRIVIKGNAPLSKFKRSDS